MVGTQSRTDDCGLPKRYAWLGGGAQTAVLDALPARSASRCRRPLKLPSPPRKPSHALDPAARRVRRRQDACLDPLGCGLSALHLGGGASWGWLSGRGVMPGAGPLPSAEQ